MLSLRNSRVFAAGDRQRGVTLIGFLFMLVIVGFFAYLAMRLIPAYTEYMGVVKSMELVKNEPNSAQASPEETEAVMRTLDAPVSEQSERALSEFEQRRRLHPG